MAQLSSDIKPGDYVKQSFFASNSLPCYKSFSNNNDLASMRNDQLKKLKDEQIVTTDSASRKDRVPPFVPDAETAP